MCGAIRFFTKHWVSAGDIRIGITKKFKNVFLCKNSVKGLVSGCSTSVLVD